MIVFRSAVAIDRYLIAERLGIQFWALVAWNLRQIRVNRGLSQKKLAFDAGIDRSYVGGLERQEENPTVALLDRLAKALSSRPEERAAPKCAADVDRPSDCYPDDRWLERSAAGSFDEPFRGLIERGIIDVCGKGPMQTWFLIGRKPPESKPAAAGPPD